MPYIKERQHIDKHLDALNKEICNYGDFTYVLYKLSLLRVKMEGECYDTYASVVGSLTNTIFELQRRGIGPYELKKCNSNGDIIV